MQCFDEALLPLHCMGGECGILLQRKPYKCPVRCSQFQICAECIKAPWCGWCAFAGYIGEGICMKGGLNNPTGVGSCMENDIRQSEGYRPSKPFSSVFYVWLSFWKCNQVMGRTSVFCTGNILRVCYFRYFVL